MLGKFFGKTVAKKATSIVARKAAPVVDDVAEEIVEEPVKKALVASKTPSKTTTTVEPTPTPAEEPMPVFGSALSEEDRSFIEQLRLGKQTEEALPAPTSTPESPYNFPNKVFTDQQYIGAETALEDSFLMPSMYANLKANKEKFANELQKKAQKLYGKPGEDVPMPYDIQSKAKTVDEAIAEVEAAKAQKPFSDITGEEDVLPTSTIDRKKSIFSGKLGTSTGAESNKVLEEIRQLREENYKTLLNMPQAQKYDEPVLDIALGEFRHKYGYEFDPAIRRDNKRITSLMDEKQKKYDVLKKKYADTPDITIYHGGSREKIASIVDTGFRRPSLSKRTAQQELRTGATSMTRDVALNFNPATGFGGTAGNVLEAKMPYADYVFTRVNMTPTEYKNKDLDATARTITGSPTGTRALQLPRTSGFFETESAYIESDKMKMARNIEGFTKKKEIIDEFTENKRKLQDKINDEVVKFVGVYQRKMTKKEAMQGYSLVRDYIQNAGKLGQVSNVKSGIGESYENAMASLFYRQDYLKLLRDALSQYGSPEKALNVSRLVDISERAMNMGTDTKIGSDALKLADKFKEGGLVRRK
jgi:hypothetical protein